MFKNILYNPVSHLFLIVLLGLLAYSNTFHSPFTFDDMGNIIENNRIKDISNIPSFFTDIEGQPIMARPLTAATFAINYFFGELDTTGYHIFNLALHIANGILLFFLIKITAEYLNYDEKKASLIALFSSLIFLTHPIQTESVTYIVTRSALLSTFFFLLGIMFFTKAVWSAGRQKIAWVAALFVTSLMGMASREEFFIFPVMLILYDLYFVSKQDIKGVVRNYKIHLPVILTLAYVIYIVLNFNYEDHAGFGVKTITPLEYLMTQFNVHWTYLRILFFPVNQNLDYDYPIAKALFELPTILSFIGYIGLWAAGIYLYKKKPVISFCILWFMITLAPSSSFMPIKDVIFEHRLYMPIMGIILAFTSSAFYVLTLRIHHSRFTAYTSQISLSAAYSLLSVIVIVFLIATYQRNIIWQDKVSLWEDVVRKSPSKGRPHNNLANAYFDLGIITEAIQEYQTTIKLEPDYPGAHNNLGNVYGSLGRLVEAINEYQIALKLKPDYVEAHYYLGVAYFDQGRLDEAINEYQIALKLKPDFVEAHYELGLAYGDLNRPLEAINEYQIALKLKPDFVEAHNNLGNVYGSLGRSVEAINEYQIALKLKPDFVEACFNLGLEYFNQGRLVEAINEYQIALKIKPDYVEAHYYLGVAYSDQGRLDEAINELKTALKIKPDFAQARQSLDFLLKER